MELYRYISKPKEHRLPKTPTGYDAPQIFTSTPTNPIADRSNLQIMEHWNDMKYLVEVDTRSLDGGKVELSYSRNIRHKNRVEPATRAFPVDQRTGARYEGGTPQWEVPEGADIKNIKIWDDLNNRWDTIWERP